MSIMYGKAASIGVGLRFVARKSLGGGCPVKIKQLIQMLTLAATMLFVAGCAADGGNKSDEEQVAKLEVNEEGEYVFPEDEMDEVVCKRVRRTGSHFLERVCRTKRQMAEDERIMMESYGPLGVESGSERRY